MAFLKREIAWLLASLPVGIALGAAASAYFGEDAALDHLTSAANGAQAGAWLALVGATAAAATTVLTRDRLRRAGGSEVLTGVIVSLGTIIAGLAMLVL
jgi:drug/metabolite transporter (DMT)-like permease